MSNINFIEAKIKLNRKYKCIFCGGQAVGDTEWHSVLSSSTPELAEKIEGLPSNGPSHMPIGWSHSLDSVYDCGCSKQPPSTRKFKVLDSSNLPLNANFDGQVLDFVRDVPDLGQITLKQPSNGGLVSFDYKNVEEVPQPTPKVST